MKNIDVKKLLDDICSKYNIGKTPLAIALGWGEKNIYRYYNDFTPSKKRINLLLKIHNNPTLFMEHLEKNKNLLSSVAYKKCKNALENEINLESNHNKKIEWILDYFISKNKELTDIGLKMMIYYMQGFSKAILKKTVFDYDLYISKDNIIYPEIEEIINQKCIPEYKESLPNNIEFNKTYVNRLEFLMLESISKIIGCYSNMFLKNMLEENNKIKKIKKSLIGEEIKFVNANIIDEYFYEIVRVYNMNAPDDIYKYVEDFYRKYIQ